MKNIAIIVFYATAIILSILIVKWVVNADIPLWLKIFLLR